MTAPRQTAIDWQPRLAREDDVPALEALIPVSVRALQAPYQALQRTAAGRRGCHRRVPWPPSLWVVRRPKHTRRLSYATFHYI